MTSPNAPPVSIGSPPGTQTAGLGDSERAQANGPAVAAPARANWSLAYFSAGGDETTMNSPCL